MNHEKRCLSKVMNKDLGQADSPGSLISVSHSLKKGQGSGQKKGTFDA